MTEHSDDVRVQVRALLAQLEGAGRLVLALLDATYELDGEPVTLETFLAANAETLSKDELHEIMHLSPGDSWTFGGGAWAVATLTRLT